MQSVILFQVFAIVVMLSGAQGAQASGHVPGEVIVKYRAGAARDRSAMNELYSRLEIRDVQRFHGIIQGMEKLSFDSSIPVAQVIRNLEGDSRVAYAQPNYLLSLPRKVETGAESAGFGPCQLPFASLLPACDHEGRIASKPPLQEAPAEVNPPVLDPDLKRMTAMKKIGAEAAWKVGRGDRKIVVAVIDTGVDYNHEDLSFNMWRNPAPTNGDIVGYDFVHDDGLPFDDHMHGTHTSGTVGAVGGNGIGVSGVSPRVSLMGIKFISAEGQGTTADAIRSIDYAVRNGARVLSNSWGGEGDEGNQALYEAIARAGEKGVLFIAAAGNGGSDSVGDDNDTSPDRAYPASFDLPNIVAVAATDDDDDLPFFSNYGKKSVHLAAPGVNILSTVPGGKFKKSTGTSMACPHVAGAAALVWAMKPSMTPLEVKKLLLDNVDKVPALEGKTVTDGRLNVAKALQSMAKD